MIIKMIIYANNAEEGRSSHVCDEYEPTIILVSSFFVLELVQSLYVVKYSLWHRQSNERRGGYVTIGAKWIALTTIPTLTICTCKLLRRY